MACMDIDVREKQIITHPFLCTNFKEAVASLLSLGHKCLHRATFFICEALVLNICAKTIFDTLVQINI